MRNGTSSPPSSPAAAPAAPSGTSAIAWTASSRPSPPLPWSELRAGTLLWDTAHRQFRRWAHADLWTRLLKAVARRRCGRVLRGLRPWICAAYRRAWRVLGLRGIAIARRLGLFDALRAPPWMLPDPDLSEQALRHLHQRLAPGQPPMARETWRLWLKVLRRLILPTRIPRALAWP
jgi:hypothetical protein